MPPTPARRRRSECKVKAVTWFAMTVYWMVCYTDNSGNLEARPLEFLHVVLTSRKDYLRATAHAADPSSEEAVRV